MRRLPALIWAVLLAGTLSACVTARQHEELQAQHRELKQSLQTQKRLLDDAKKDHLAVVARLRQQLSEAQNDLRNKTTEFDKLWEKYTDTQQKHKIASDELSRSAANSLALIEEKKQLNAAIIELQGTISTLRDTVKDLQDQLDEAAPLEPQPGDQPSEVPR
ncbi:MAG: hypothetical protein KAT11_03170 [Phycisphaerae bacterium]|nr:hypothetical protein [Phycisphaerae bacterium]